MKLNSQYSERQLGRTTVEEKKSAQQELKLKNSRIKNEKCEKQVRVDKREQRQAVERVVNLSVGSCGDAEIYVDMIFAYIPSSNGH